MKIAWLCQYPVALLKDELKCEVKRFTHPSSWIINLSNELAKDIDIELHIITLSPYLDKDYYIIKNNLHFHLLERFYKVPFYNLGLPWYFPLEALTFFYFDKYKLDRELKKISPDITHIHGTENNYGISDYAVNKPHLVTLQGLANKYYEVDKNLLSIPFCHLERKTIKKYKYFGSRTKFGDDFIKSVNNNSKIFYLAEAINPVYFGNDREENNENIIYIGEIIKRKNPEVLIRSLDIVKHKFNNVKLIIVGSGDGEYINYLKTLSKKLAVADNISWVGRKTPEEIKGLLKKSLIFVLPTNIDNSPNSLLEAMTSGLLCIASNVGGIPSIIENEKNGFLFEKNNEKELANIIIKIFNGEIDKTMVSNNARNFTVSHYSVDKVVANINKIYSEIINEY